MYIVQGEWAAEAPAEEICGGRSEVAGRTTGLRDAGAAGRTKGFLYLLFIIYMEGPKVEEGSNKYIDYHYEASEYEKKLIQVSDHQWKDKKHTCLQVAEMHGELLEFNENLQKTVQVLGKYSCHLPPIW